MLENREGQNVPHATFINRENGDWAKYSTDDIFKNKTVVVFSLPGAFTPTCSSTHLPRYSELSGVFKANGVDSIICVSVNDGFVMEAWSVAQNIENVHFMSDGSGEFTEGMGMLVDKSDIGFGKRSWRYSMLVKNGVIEKMFIEPNEPGDPFKVSDADTMLNYINADAKKPDFVTVFTRHGCPYCVKAKELLTQKGLPYEEIALNEGVTTKTLQAVTGHSTVPQVFIGGKHIGGSEALEAYFA